MAMAETASNQLHTCLRIMNVRRIPKMSIFMNVTTKGVKEKAQKLPKKEGKIWSWHRRFFYQYLWVTKLCIKFDRSRIPRTANAPIGLTLS